MTNTDIELLKANIDKPVRVSCTDGEVFVGKALFVSDEEQDLVYDLISTSKESHYEKADRQPAFRIKFEEIASVAPFSADEPSGAPAQ
jgi:hypothetical protein